MFSFYRELCTYFFNKSISANSGLAICLELNVYSELENEHERSHRRREKFSGFEMHSDHFVSKIINIIDEIDYS